jgi:hypothetical protein
MPALPSSDFATAPVCIFSFNRPDYLRATVASIVASMKSCFMVGPVILFQDGSLNPHTGQLKSELAPIESCIAVFRELCPHGVVFDSKVNLGIASNIYRGETWAFAQCGYPVALFFEDDMVVGSNYFAIMSQLNDMAKHNPRIGMFSAYGGDVHMSANEQYEERGGITSMHHNWAFALRRETWLKREIHTEKYMQIIAESDYRTRSFSKITTWYNSMGWPPLATNQDLAKSVVLNHLGMVRITTVATFGKYIGRIGEHYDESDFDRLHFGDAVLFGDRFPDVDVRLAPIGADAIDRIWRFQRKDIMEHRMGLEHVLRDPEFSSAAQIIAGLGGESFLRRCDGVYCDFVTGLHGDLWAGPSFSFVIKNKINVARIELAGMFAPHLPADTKLTFFVNGAQVASRSKNGGQDFHMEAAIGDSLDDLRTVFAVNCNVVSDPFSAGHGPDRRPLAFHIHTIKLVIGGETVAFTGTAIVSEFVRV